MGSQLLHSLNLPPWWARECQTVFNSNWATGEGSSIVVILIARWVCLCWVQINTGASCKGNYQMECFLYFPNWSVVLWHCSRKPNTSQTENHWVETSALTQCVSIAHKYTNTHTHTRVRARAGQLGQGENWTHTGKRTNSQSYLTTQDYMLNYSAFVACYNAVYS